MHAFPLFEIIINIIVYIENELSAKMYIIIGVARGLLINAAILILLLHPKVRKLLKILIKYLRCAVKIVS